MLKSI